MFGEPAVYVEGALGPVRLNNPEGVALDADNNIWCGGAAGEIYRITPDGSSFELVASTGGFVLGIAFDRDGFLYACDLGAKTVFRFDPRTRELIDLPVLPDGKAMVAPNYPVVDHARDRLLVSDSNEHHVPGGGVWAIDLATGAAELWYAEPLDFANGLAMGVGGDELFLVESWGGRVIRIPILPDGTAGTAEVVAADIPGIGDGLAVDSQNRVYIACYTPSQILRITDDPASRYEVIASDDLHQVMCHPTNIAFAPGRILTANLGGHHITGVALPDDVVGAPLL